MVELRITFVAFGNSVLTDEGDDWKLSDLGIRQAQRRREAIKDPKFDLVLSSSENQAIETARIISGSELSVVNEVPELGTPIGRDGEILEEMSNNIEHRPLGRYFDVCSHQGQTDQLRCLKSFADNGWKAVANRGWYNKKTPPESILIVTHALYCQLIGWAAPHRRTPKGLLDFYMPECGAFQIILEGGEVTDCIILPNVRTRGTRVSV